MKQPVASFPKGAGPKGKWFLPLLIKFKGRGPRRPLSPHGAGTLHVPTVVGCPFLRRREEIFFLQPLSSRRGVSRRSPPRLLSLFFRADPVSADRLSAFFLYSARLDMDFLFFWLQGSSPQVALVFLLSIRVPSFSGKFGLAAGLLPPLLARIISFPPPFFFFSPLTGSRRRKTGLKPFPLFFLPSIERDRGPF